MRFLPVFLDLVNRPCLVVGGGVIATRKINRLLKAGAEVTVVAPELCDEVQSLCNDQKIRFVAADFSSVHLDSMVLVIAAAGDEEINRGGAGWAEARLRS